MRSSPIPSTRTSIFRNVTHVLTALGSEMNSKTKNRLGVTLNGRTTFLHLTNHNLLKAEVIQVRKSWNPAASQPRRFRSNSKEACAVAAAAHFAEPQPIGESSVAAATRISVGSFNHRGLTLPRTCRSLRQSLRLAFRRRRTRGGGGVVLGEVGVLGGVVVFDVEDDVETDAVHQLERADGHVPD